MKILTVVGQASSEDQSKKRFLLNHMSFYQKLVCDLKIPPENIFSFFFGFGDCKSMEFLKKEMESLILEYRNEDICLIYIGHGQENGWALTGGRDVETFIYDELRLSLALHSGRLVFLNDCCYGGAGADALPDQSGNNLLISPMPASHSGLAYSFLTTIVENWMKNEFYNPETAGDNTDSKPVMIGNPELQRIFFPPIPQINSEASNVE